MVKTTIITESHLSNKCFDYNHGRIRETQITKISRWIDSNDTKINLEVEFDWEKQCVGPIGSLLKLNGNRPDEESGVFCKGGCDSLQFARNITNTPYWLSGRNVIL